MRYLVFFLTSIILTQSARADFIFSVTRRDAGNVQVGDSVIFDVAVATGPNLGSISNLGGVTFYLGADDPAFTGNSTSAGRWANGTNDSSDAIAAGRSYLFAPSDGGYLNKPATVADRSSFVAFSVSGANRSLSTAGALLGSFVLDTKGATVGVHTLQFDIPQLDAIDSQGFQLAGPFSGQSLTLNIAAVPEPGSFVLTGIITLCYALKIRKKRDVC